MSAVGTEMVRLCPCGDTVRLRLFLVDWYGCPHFRAVGEDAEDHIGEPGHLDGSFWLAAPPPPRSR